jgi:hypothetical protein
MHVGVDESRNQELSIAILDGHLGAGRDVRPDLGDDAVFDPYVDGRGAQGSDVSE